MEKCDFHPELGSHLQQSSPPPSRAGTGNYYKLLDADDVTPPPTAVTGLTAQKMAFTGRDTAPTELTSSGCLKGNVFIKACTLLHFLFCFHNHHHNKIIAWQGAVSFLRSHSKQPCLPAIMWVLGVYLSRAYNPGLQRLRYKMSVPLQCWCYAIFPAPVLTVRDPWLGRWSSHTPHTYLHCPVS